MEVDGRYHLDTNNTSGCSSDNKDAQKSFNIRI